MHRARLIGLFFLFVMVSVSQTEAIEKHGLSFYMAYWNVTTSDDWEWDGFYYSSGASLAKGTYRFEQQLSNDPSDSYIVGVYGIYAFTKKFELKYGLEYANYNTTVRTTTSKWEEVAGDYVLNVIKNTEVGPFNIITLSVGISYFYYGSSQRRWVPFIGLDLLAGIRSPQVEEDPYHSMLIETTTDEGDHYFLMPKIGIAFLLTENSRVSFALEYRNNLSATYPLYGYDLALSYEWDI
ncbi:hypothetical protein ACFL27_18585 [candidate division CSSED10-310 bacterium]|uniref:Outer membrane protein beta-barrel domain-containing protein n=1 Tax=candidate division CSSED10-310 bacterium TaxID=2855610 RepID=A0ABV6Z191_UNCC1